MSPAAILEDKQDNPFVVASIESEMENLVQSYASSFLSILSLSEAEFLIDNSSIHGERYDGIYNKQ